MLRTYELYKDFDAQGNPLLILSYDWDDETTPPRVTMVHIVNNDTRPRTIQATSTFNSKLYSFVVSPGAVIDQAVPSGAQTRLQVTVRQPSGRLDGIEWQFS